MRKGFGKRSEGSFRLDRKASTLRNSTRSNWDLVLIPQLRFVSLVRLTIGRVFFVSIAPTSHLIYKAPMKIGLLGGSFNPAHDGHLHISKIALQKLGLRQLWWLVSPQNPLKSTEDMADFVIRYDHATKVAEDNPQIKVMGIEVEIGTIYTAETIARLKLKFPHYEFVWIMGADNLVQLPRWKHWEQICQQVEIHVFDRNEYLYEAMNGKAVAKYADKIHYHYIRKNPISATEIRSNS